MCPVSVGIPGPGQYWKCTRLRPGRGPQLEERRVQHGAHHVLRAVHYFRDSLEYFVEEAQPAYLAVHLHVLLWTGLL